MKEGTFPCRILSKDELSVRCDVLITPSEFESTVFEERLFPLDVVRGIVDLRPGAYFTLKVEQEPGELSFKFSYGAEQKYKDVFEDLSEFDDLRDFSKLAEPENV